MQAFNFHPATRRYLGATDADPDQQQPGRWLFPAFSTNVEPPAVPAGSVAVFTPAPTEADPHAGAWAVEELPVYVEPPAAAPAPVEPPAAAPAPLSESVAHVTLLGEVVDPVTLTQPHRVDASRRALLAASDWVVIRAMERGEPVPEAWRVYRDALRDVDKQEGYPDSIVWPELPQ